MSLYQRVQHGLRNGDQVLAKRATTFLRRMHRAALTTANNVGGGIVGDYKMPGAGFDHDMGALMLMDALNVVPIPRGELLVYSGDTAPVPIWAAEGAALADATTPTVGRVEAAAQERERLSLSSLRRWPRHRRTRGGNGIPFAG